MTPRIFNILLGTWLFLSSFAWPHSSPAFVVALACGALTVLLSLASSYASGVRYLIAAVAVILLVASLTTSASRWDKTFWHNSVVAVAIFIAALLDRGTAGVRHERELYGRV
jgi:hypothetical protein